MKGFRLSHDILRHTFVSCHVSRFHSVGDTALQAGNSERMIKKHYLNIITKAEAEKFWQIAPEGMAEKVVKFGEVAS